MLPEAADLAQNRLLWRMMSTYGATRVACQKRRRPAFDAAVNFNCLEWARYAHAISDGKVIRERGARSCNCPLSHTFAGYVSCFGLLFC